MTSTLHYAIRVPLRNSTGPRPWTSVNGSVSPLLNAAVYSYLNGWPHRIETIRYPTETERFNVRGNKKMLARVWRPEFAQTVAELIQAYPLVTNQPQGPGIDIARLQRILWWRAILAPMMLEAATLNDPTEIRVVVRDPSSLEREFMRRRDTYILSVRGEVCAAA